MQPKDQFALLTRYIDFGLSILPVHQKGGSIRPLIQKWQTGTQITKNNLSTYVHANAWGIVTGSPSGNLEAIDFDEKHRKGIYELYVNLLPKEGRDLLATLPISTTKNGGFHVLYRCKEVFCNTKLAKTKTGEVMIETRGEGGFVFEYPTPKYKFVNRLSLLHEITPEERSILLDTAKKLNEETKNVGEQERGKSQISTETKIIKYNNTSNEETIFDEFNNRNEWADILIPLGWKKIGTSREEIFWQRPGKTDGSISATENYKGLGLLHMFTTSSDIPDGRSYNKFQIYSLLKHGGDNKKALSAIKEEGYGKKVGKSQNCTAPQSVSPNDDGLIFIRASDIAPKPVEWLWNGKIAKGKLSLIAGEPGLGKSQISVDMASVVSCGGKFPLANTIPEGKVIMFSAEDGNADTIVPRLKACGAKMENVLLFSITRKNGKERYFDLKEDLPFLEQALERETGVSLITIDPITAFLGDTDSHINAEVRGLLSGLSKLAEKYNIAITVITHLNKSINSTASNKVSGSVAFVAAVRSAFMVVKDNNNEDRRLFTTIKNNLAKDKTTLGFKITEVNITPEIQTSKVEWESVAIEMSANEILREQGLSSGASDKSVKWLEEFLQRNPQGMKLQDIENIALRSGISRRSLFNAKKTAMVEVVSTGNRNEKIWKYAGFIDADEISPDDIPI
jgi:putative DNA primase/helicase